MIVLHSGIMFQHKSKITLSNGTVFSSGLMTYLKTSRAIYIKIEESSIFYSLMSQLIEIRSVVYWVTPDLLIKIWLLNNSFHVLTYIQSQPDQMCWRWILLLRKDIGYFQIPHLGTKWALLEISYFWCTYSTFNDCKIEYIRVKLRQHIPKKRTNRFKKTFTTNRKNDLDSDSKKNKKICWFTNLKKNRLWILKVEKKYLQMFPLTFKVCLHGKITSKLILNHLLAFDNNV